MKRTIFEPLHFGQATFMCVVRASVHSGALFFLVLILSDLQKNVNYFWLLSGNRLILQNQHRTSITTEYVQ